MFDRDDEPDTSDSTDDQPDEPVVVKNATVTPNAIQATTTAHLPG